MKPYVLRRLALAIPTLGLVSVIVFSMMRLMPGDVVIRMVEGHAYAPTIEALRKELGLDRPAYLQYLEWIGGILLRGDFGHSYWTRQPILDEFVGRFPVTIELAALTILVSVVIGVLVGIVSAVRQDTVSDYAGRILAILALSVPYFGLAVLVALVLGALLAVPLLLDMPAIQTYASQAASHALGRPVKFSALSVSALPLPTVKLRGLEVAEDSSFGPGPFVTVTEGRMRIRIRPLLQGRVELADLTLEEPRIHVVEEFKVPQPKTRLLAQKVKSMGLGEVLVITDEMDSNLTLSSRNLPNVEVIAAKQANPVALVRYPAVLLTRRALARLEEMFK